MMRSLASLRKTVWKYYRAHRRSMPWRAPPLFVRKDRSVNPYPIVVSEIMLQQTQVSRVMEKYPVFMRQFPDFASLDRAPLARVLKAWGGLGYNRRALFLKRFAHKVVSECGGIVPRSFEALEAFPGIGKATAGSICAFAFNERVAFIETNIRRVFIHFFFKNKKRVSDASIAVLVHKTLPRTNAREWYYALMDYGAMLASVVQNPNQRSASYVRQSRFQGSSRELRGIIVKMVLLHARVSLKTIVRTSGRSVDQVCGAATSLARDGLVRVRGNFVYRGDR